MTSIKEESIARLIQNFSANTNKTAKQKQTKGFLVARRKLLEEYWTKYASVHEEVVALETTTDSAAEAKRLADDQRFAAVEAAYCDALGELIDQIDQMTQLFNQSMAHSSPDMSAVTHLHTSSPKSKLPKIELPKFGGTFQEWLTFKDMFTTCVIDDTTLADVQRLHYLKSSLHGEAEVLLRNLPIMENNFQTAWDILLQRFDNKRRLIKTYLRDIVALPAMNSESASSMRTILDGVTEAIRALEQLGRPTAQWDDWLVFIITERLDPTTVKEWEMSLASPNEIPSYASVKKFLENRIQGLEAVMPNHPSEAKQRNSKQFVQHAVAIRSHQTNVQRCPNCDGKHILMFCPNFRGLTALAKLNFVAQHNLCKNCFKAGHCAQECSSSWVCKQCQQTHHTMLHESLRTHSVNVNHAYTANSEIEQPLSPVMLPTAQIGLRSETGHHLRLRALLDSGSQASFISEFAVQRLQLSRRRLQVPVTGVGGSTVGRAIGVVQFSIYSLIEPEFSINCSALILPRLGHLLPNKRVDPQRFGDFLELDLADPKFYEPGSIDVIIGADLFGSLLRGEMQKSTNCAPVAQNTHLGWIVYGSLSTSATLQLNTTFQASTITDLNDLVQNLWKFNELEDVASSSTMTQDELYCEKLFERTVRRNSTGRYIVKYPTKDSIDLSALAGTKSNAWKLFQVQLSRLEKDPNMKTLYDDFMAEYVALGHMEQVCETEEPTPVCYIPHHGVYKESSSTTKLRTVFNASRKCQAGVSLNDCLHVGPNLQKDLTSIILKWRMHRIGFMADIEKCYRQILVEKEDAELQRIIWKGKDGNPTVYRLLTVTYGLNCSPYLTMKVLHTLARDEEAYFPEAAKVLRESFYMDDCLHGADSIDAAIELRKQLQDLLKCGGFVLRKWCSNAMDFVQQSDDETCKLMSGCDLNLSQETKALGIYWFCQRDCIGYKVSVTPLLGPITKRQQISDVAKIYDPACILAPVIITGKIMCQRLWLSGCAWDDPLPEPYQQEWIKFRQELPLVENVKLHRWTFSSPDAKNHQLHVFADASTSAYAAVAYLRVETADGEIKNSILMAKTKVAPLKKITVPCLELNGALLAAKVVAKTLQTLNMPSLPIYCWSDSKTVLSWIRSSPGVHKQYVSNRITKIQEMTEINWWRYVPTESNPADIASRGVFPSQLAGLETWWRGPSWLYLDQTHWPVQQNSQPEVTALVTAVSPDQPTSELAMSLLSKYSKISTLLAVTSWCQRFITAARSKQHETTLWITAMERRSALTFWIRYVQNLSFTNEILCLQQKKHISPRSKVLKLNPMLDEFDVMRLNGRLKNAILPDSERFPIILPKDSPLSNLLIAQAHDATMHGGTQATLNFLRRRYWVIDARSAIKKYIHRCVICFRQNPHMTNQLMGSLPAHRCTAAPAFRHCGLDYGGPFKIRPIKGRGYRGHKGYVALFVCLSTRAIHLELVSDMTTDAFLAALHRFFSQRGYSHDIYSDCATTFVGANSVMKEDIEAFRQQLKAGAQFVECHDISWHFIPPGSPNFGGIWEAGIKSMKHHLKRTIGEAILTFEEMYTVLKQVEAVLNSRPLSALSDDPTDVAALTPGHFLVGGPLTSAPEPSLLDINTGRLTRWKQLQQIQQDFWKRWSSEYLHELQARPKWRQVQENLKIGNLVLIRDERLPPSQWALGRILEAHAGDDDRVRVATIRTQNSIIKRAISKLIVLPIDDQRDGNGGRSPENLSISSHVHEVGGNVEENAALLS